MYFSINTAPSPKAETASLIARSICSSNSASFSTIRIPFPPPPALALISIGYPISAATFFASGISEIASSVPGTKGMS